MRRRLTVVLCCALLALPGTGFAAPGAVGCDAVRVDIGTVGECTGGGSVTVGGVTGRRWSAAELVTALSQTPEIERCTILAARTSEPGREAVAMEQLLAAINRFLVPFGPPDLLNRMWAEMLERLPGCPSARPEEVAFSFLRQVVPPGPEPHIAPGYAITGKLAYLETRGPTSEVRRLETPLGTLVVTLRATRFTVDWGDGSGADQGPFPAPGRPWPYGTARHGYTVAGRYDVVVTQLWEAEWGLAGEGGTIPELTSVGTIPGFEARQVQAVRNR